MWLMLFVVGWLATGPHYTDVARMPFHHVVNQDVLGGQNNLYVFELAVTRFDDQRSCTCQVGYGSAMSVESVRGLVSGTLGLVTRVPTLEVGKTGVLFWAPRSRIEAQSDNVPPRQLPLLLGIQVGGRK